MKKENTKLNISGIICALTHNLDVCERCKKCKGKNFAEIRMNLVDELSKYVNEKENKNGL